MKAFSLASHAAKNSLTIAVAITLILSLTVFASEHEVEKKVDDYTVNVKFDRNPPARGENNIDITVKDASSKPVTDAQVAVEYLMPSFPGRPPMMEYSTSAKPSGGHYLARIDLTMAGEWTVVVKVTHGKRTGSTQFTFVVK